MIQIDSGLIEGVAADGVRSFKGLPYVAPLMGGLDAREGTAETQRSQRETGPEEPEPEAIWRLPVLQAFRTMVPNRLEWVLLSRELGDGSSPNWMGVERRA